MEWRSPEFGAAELLPFRLFLAGLLLVAIWLPARSRDPFLLLTAAAWTFATLGSVRFLAIAGPLLVVALAPAVGMAVARWQVLTAGSDVREDVPEAAVGPERPSASGRKGSGAAMAIAGVAIVGILAAGWLIIDAGRQAAAIQRRLPVPAVAAFDASACTARLLPAYGWAGYVIWTTRRQIGAYGNSSEGPVTEQAQLEAVLMDPAPWLDEHGIGAVLMPAGGPLSHWLDEAEAWRLTYKDPQATVHVRVGSPGCAIPAARVTRRSPRGQPSTRG